jgi:hypothetical protein
MPTTLYSKNADFFATDNEKSFYWAGFMAADGCIMVKKIKGVEYLNGLRLSLSTKDRSHIELFRDHIEYDGSIYDGIAKNSHNNQKWNDTGYSSMTINSIKLYKDLARFNVVPRKTHIYTFPKWLVGHPMVNHFMRGYFDGDGFIGFDTKGNKRFCVRGTIPFLTDFKNVLIENCGVNDNTVKNSSGIGRVRYNGNGVCSKLSKFFYKDATIFLDRKKNIFEEDASIFNTQYGY